VVGCWRSCQHGQLLRPAGLSLTMTVWCIQLLRPGPRRRPRALTCGMAHACDEGCTDSGAASPAGGSCRNGGRGPGAAHQEKEEVGASACARMRPDRSAAPVVRACVRACVHACMRTRIHAYTHTRIHAHAHAHTHCYTTTPQEEDSNRKPEWLRRKRTSRPPGYVGESSRSYSPCDTLSGAAAHRSP